MKMSVPTDPLDARGHGKVGSSFNYGAQHAAPLRICPVADTPISVGATPTRTHFPNFSGKSGHAAIGTRCVL